MTTQSPHFYQRLHGPADGGTARTGRSGTQTRLPWWAVALPVAAFAALLALIGGGSAHASTAASGGELFGWIVFSLAALAHHVL